MEADRDSAYAGRLAELFEAKLASERADTRRFSLLFVLLTPPLLIVSGLSIAVALSSSSMVGVFANDLWSKLLMLAFVGILLVRYWRGRVAGSQSAAQQLTFAAVFAILALLSVLMFATSISTSKPILFWSLVGSAAFLLLALLGRSYRPRESYYFGWVARRGMFMDDVFTLRDDFDRAHATFGFLAAIPTLILSAYAQVFASRWVWKGLTPEEGQAATDVLLALQREDVGSAVGIVERLGEERGGRVLQVLSELELVLPPTREEALRLAVDGRRLLGAAV